MSFAKIKSNAKINLALNVVGKSKKLHKIESLVAFIEHHDLILIKRIRSKNHRIVFNGKFSKNISSSNTISKLLKLLERKKLIHQKYFIKSAYPRSQMKAYILQSKSGKAKPNKS